MNERFTFKSVDDGGKTVIGIMSIIKINVWQKRSHRIRFQFLNETFFTIKENNERKAFT